MINTLGIEQQVRKAATIKVVELPKKFQNSYLTFEILERTGIVCLVKITTVTGGKARYDLCFIKQVRDRDLIEEKITESMNWDGTDPKSDCFNLEKMRDHYQKAVEKNVLAQERRIRVNNEQKEVEIKAEIEAQKVKDAHELAIHLQKELREINEKSDKLAGILSNKRGKEILTELAMIDQLLKMVL